VSRSARSGVEGLLETSSEVLPIRSQKFQNTFSDAQFLLFYYRNVTANRGKGPRAGGSTSSGNKVE
jgi:hypothetical protein